MWFIRVYYINIEKIFHISKAPNQPVDLTWKHHLILEMLLLNKKNRSAINEVKFMAQSNSCKKKRNPTRQLKVLSLFTGYHDNKNMPSRLKNT